MTSEGLGDMFEDHSADKCAEKVLLVSMGAKQRFSRAQTREQGPPSVPAEILYLLEELFDFRTPSLFPKPVSACLPLFSCL